MFGNKSAAEGLPLSRHVRGAEDYEDILAGNDFLSVLMESTLHRLKKETTTMTEEPVDLVEETMSTEPYNRETREAANYFNEVPQTTEEQSVSYNTSDSTSSDGVIIAVHVSSSVGSHINKHSERKSESDVVGQNVLPSLERSSLISNSAKSELNVEVPTPVTMDNEDTISESSVDLNKFQASIKNLPSSQTVIFSPTRFTNNQDKKNVPPFHHSVIYHDNPSEPGRARSVSYSTIIQDIQPTNDRSPESHERKERNYETGTIYQNSFGNADAKSEDNESEKGDPSNYMQSNTTPPNSMAGSSMRNETTEKTWANSYPPPAQQIPKIYGRPEQNYEVDEAVSVVTNGRTHGIQRQNSATQKPKSDQDKDQKVGYVVEGRNYRKYRVEERTSDGFIVGEYGVVSHDDGSLRGVRYTADGTINPRLIYDALMKFLAL